MVIRPSPAVTNTPVELDTRPLSVPARTLIPSVVTEIPLDATANKPDVFATIPELARTAIASAETEIPLPDPTSIVNTPEVPPPLRPLPAVTVVIGVFQKITVPFEVRTSPFDPAAPFAQMLLATRLAVITLSIPEVEFATSAWFAVRVPGTIWPPMRILPETPSGAPMNSVLPACVNASSPA